MNSMIFLTFTRWHELRAKGRKSFIWQYGYLRAAIPAGFGVALLSLNAKYGLSWETLFSRLFVNELLRKFIFFVPLFGYLGGRVMWHIGESLAADSPKQG